MLKKRRICIKLESWRRNAADTTLVRTVKRPVRSIAPRSAGWRVLQRSQIHSSNNPSLSVSIRG